MIIRFEVTNVNRTDNPALNKTIYFALNNIELYNRNCQSMIEASTSPMTTSTITSQSPVTTIPTTTRGETSGTPSHE
ncbi:unnamed protein product [Rotaria sp. Silwood1]|nr:unnamed protein product [Rotaria sp. Silwood1]